MEFVPQSLLDEIAGTDWSKMRSPAYIPLISAIMYATGMLEKLLFPNGGAPAVSGDPNVVKRRTQRAAREISSLFSEVIKEVNTLRNLAAFPVTLREVILRRDGGPSLIEVSQEQRILSNVAVSCGKAAGRSIKSTVGGLMGQVTCDGKIKTKRVAELMGLSESYIESSQRKVKCGDLGTFGGQQRTCEGADVMKLKLNVEKLKKGNAPYKEVASAADAHRAAKKSVRQYYSITLELLS